MSARKGYEILDGVAKSNFNFEYFIVSIYVIYELLLHWKLKKNPLGKKRLLFLKKKIYICTDSLS